MGFQLRHGRLGNVANGGLILLAETGNEILHQQRDVLRPLSQRREVNGNDFEPPVKIFPEAALLNFFLKVLIGRRDDSHIGPDVFLTTEPFKFTVLEHPQHFSLSRQGHIPDFIEKERAIAASLELPDMGSFRTGKSSPFMSEQLALKQGFGNCRAVDGQKRGILAVTVVIDGAGHQLLAGPTFARDEDGHVLGGNLPDKLINLLHPPMPADDLHHSPRGRRRTGKQAGKRHQLLHSAVNFERICSNALQFLPIKGLGQIVVGSQLHGFDGGVGGAVGGHDDHGSLDLRSSHLTQRIQAVQTGHFVVEQDQIERFPGDQIQGRLAITAVPDVVSLFRKEATEKVNQALIIVDYQDLFHLPPGCALKSCGLRVAGCPSASVLLLGLRLPQRGMREC